MKIILITPANRRSKAGNRTTAVRWANILRKLGHKVKVDVEYQGENVDLMIALHAWRSAKSIEAYREKYPLAPLIVALTGTDIYRFQFSHPEITTRSMDMADALVCLHDLVYQAIPQRFAKKLQVIYQSALPLPGPRKPSSRHVDICVVGHLRDEKDPFRTALAARELPGTSKIRILQFGKAYNDDWARQAENEMKSNPRYFWRGEVPGWVVRKAFASSHLMVLSSIMEGGANVISEAVAAGVPVIASAIPGSIGLLGEDYPGYYPVSNTQALKNLLNRAENEPDFIRELEQHCDNRRPLFAPEHESQRWKKLLAGIC